MATNSDSLRARLLAAGVIGPDADPPMRLVSAMCPRCGFAQHHVIAPHHVARCIETTCNAELEPS